MNKTLLEIKESLENKMDLPFRFERKGKMLSALTIEKVGIVIGYENKETISCHIDFSNNIYNREVAIYWPFSIKDGWDVDKFVTKLKEDIILIIEISKNKGAR